MSTEKYISAKKVSVKSPYVKSTDVDKDLAVFQLVKTVLPEVESVTRFLERRSSRLKQHENFMKYDYKITLENMKKCLQKSEVASESRRRFGVDEPHVKQEDDSSEDLIAADCCDIDVQEMQKPAWTRRWKTLITPNGEESKRADTTNSCTSNHSHSGQTRTTASQYFFDDPLRKPARTFSASVTESSGAPETLRFRKVRNHRYGRSSSHTSVETLWLSQQPKFAGATGRFPDNSLSGIISQQISESASNQLEYYKSVIHSDIETDIEEFSDNAIDTDTDTEGRYETRCFVFDPLDGQPHPFWGIEVEQSSWVSVPNPAKLDPECKILKMLWAMKAPHEYNSSLLVRHYKPFLKFSMLHGSLFELWGKQKINKNYLISETEAREFLSRLEKEFTGPNPPPPRVSVSEEDQIEIDVRWIRSRVEAFRKLIRRNKHMIYDPNETPSIDIPCPVDPTWRNIYTSRVRLPKQLKKKITLMELNSPEVTELLEGINKEIDSYYTKNTNNNQKTVECEVIEEEDKEENDSRTPERTKCYQSFDSSDETFIPTTSFRWFLSHTTPKYKKYLKRFPSCPDCCSTAELSSQQDLDNKETLSRQQSQTHSSRRGSYQTCLTLSAQQSEIDIPRVIEPQSSDNLLFFSGTFSPMDKTPPMSKISKSTAEKKVNNSTSFSTSESDIILDTTTLSIENTSNILYESFSEKYKLIASKLKLGSPKEQQQRLENSSENNDVKKKYDFFQQIINYRNFVKNREKLRVRRKRRSNFIINDLKKEGDSWIKFHQIRDIKELNKFSIPPTPVPNPTFITYLTEERRGGPWPTFIPTIFRGPGRYENLQECLLQTLWTSRQNNLFLPRPEREKMKLWGGGFMVPHDEKRYRSGDDSWCVSEPLSCLGVCDGVGEMSATQWRAAGFDCRGFGEDILREAKSRLEMIRNSKNRYIPGSRSRMIMAPNSRRCDKEWSYVRFDIDPLRSIPSMLALESVIYGFYHKTTTWGAATCLFGCLDHNGSKIGFANIGDSKAAIFRRGEFSTGSLTVVGHTEPEQHGWNLPVQMARLPDRNRVRSMRDDPKLKELVKTLDACRATGQDINDPAESAILYDFNIQEGDLIIIGTDGLWDNVFENEVAALCGIAISPYESTLLCGTPLMATSPRDICKGLCHAAYWRSMLTNVDTPFAQSVRNAGGVMLGGKQDDISVVAAWVVANKDENTYELLTRSQLEYAEALKQQNLDTETFKQQNLNTETFKQQNFDTETFKQQNFDTETFKQQNFDTETFKPQNLATETFKQQNFNIKTFKHQYFDAKAKT